MKKPPPSRQEPSYQSPPQPPPPLQQQEPSYQSPPPSHQQEPSQARGPRITYIPPQRIFYTPKENFKSLVQRLTGKPPTTSTTPSSSSSPYTSAQNYTSAAFEDDSPAMEMYDAELEKTKPRLGFAGGVETTYQYHQSRDNQRPNLSPGSSSSLWAELFSTTTSPQDHSNLPWDEDVGIPHDTRTIGSDYDDMYLRNVQTPSLPSEELGRFNGVGGMGRPGGDNLHMGGEVITERGRVFPSDSGPNGTRAIGSGQPDLGGRPSQDLLRLPPDASSTLFVEGLPSDCSMREVAHIFRPFPGYKEVRLVTKDSKHRNGDPVVVGFVDFGSPASAATARNARQGYRMDEEEPDSESLQIQFSRNTGPRPG